MTEKELLNKLKKGDEKAFEKLFRTYFAALQNYAIFYTGSSQTAEDMVHDIFFKIWENRQKLSIRTSIKSYLYRSVHNNCIQYLRHSVVVREHNKKQVVKLEEALLMNRMYFESGLSKLFEKEIGEKLEEALLKLPEKTREIFIMSRNLYNKNSEIALKLDVTEKTVEYHISQALSLLRKELKAYLPSTVLLILIVLNS